MSEESLVQEAPTASPLTGAAALEATICEVIARELDVPVHTVREAGSLRETPGMESLRLLRAVTGVEKYFNVELPDELVFDIDSISELAELVHDQLTGQVMPEAPRAKNDRG